MRSISEADISCDFSRRLGGRGESFAFINAESYSPDATPSKVTGDGHKPKPFRMKKITLSKCGRERPPRAMRASTRAFFSEALATNLCELLGGKQVPPLRALRAALVGMTRGLYCV